MECKEYGFAILNEIPYNYIYDLSKKEGDML
jgi:hypothetical protein